MRTTMGNITLFFVVIVSAALFSSATELLPVGEKFPNFSLQGHDGAIVDQSALDGNYTLVYFYPKADTPGCTREACVLRDSWDDATAAGLQVLGVSYDTPDVNAAFALKHRLPFLLLSDCDRSLADSVGATRALLPLPKRISYLVDPQRRVVATYAKVDPSGHAAEVLADLETIKAAIRNPPSS